MAVMLAFSWLGSRFEASHGCESCGVRLCPRCEPDHADCELCPDCSRLFYQPEQTARGLRVERMGVLQSRERRLQALTALVALLLPAAAGAITRRPVAMFLGALVSSLMLACLIWPRGPMPDPLVAGGAAPLAILSLGMVAALFHVWTALRAVSERRRMQRT